VLKCCSRSLPPVLNSARQTGSVLGIALFGSLRGGNGAFITGAHVALVIAAALLLATAAMTAFSRPVSARTRQPERARS
jgi:MFS transporter, DHA2 family, methylenomycin A resistance protein